MDQSQYNPYGYNEEQLWCLGLSAINAQGNGERHDVLAHSDPERFRNTLSAWWDIDDRKTYLESVQWLRSGGHRKGFNEIVGQVEARTSAELSALMEEISKKEPRLSHQYRMVNHYRTVMSGCGIAAWDLARVVLLARMACTCGYIDEAEAWQTIFSEAHQANSLFRNWYAFAHSYLIGRQFAMRNLNDDSGMENIKSTHLLLTDPASPWLRYPDFGSYDFGQLTSDPFTVKKVH